MSGPRINYGKVIEDNPKTLMDRIQSIAGTNITQATITGITYQTFEYASQSDAEQDINGTEIGASATLTVADVVFDTPQTTAPWDTTLDSVGFNFKFTVPAARFPTGGKWIVVEPRFDPSSGDDFNGTIWIIEVLARRAG